MRRPIRRWRLVAIATAALVGVGLLATGSREGADDSGSRETVPPKAAGSAASGTPSLERGPGPGPLAGIAPRRRLTFAADAAEVRCGGSLFTRRQAAAVTVVCTPGPGGAAAVWTASRNREPVLHGFAISGARRDLRVTIPVRDAKALDAVLLTRERTRRPKRPGRLLARGELP